MDKLFLRIINTGLLFSVGLLCLLFRPCLAGTSNLKFGLTLDKEEYKIEEPVNVTFSLKNKGKTAVYVNKRFYLAAEEVLKEKRDVFLVVTSPSGIKLRNNFSYEAGFPKTDYFELLEPGIEIVSEYKRNLKGYFELNEPGTYTVTAVYENVFGKEIGLDTFREKITSAPVTFKIVRPDTSGAKDVNKK